MAERMETSWQYGGYGRSYNKGGYPGGGNAGIGSMYNGAQGVSGYKGQHGGGGVPAGPASRGMPMSKKNERFEGTGRRWSGIPAELGRGGAWRIVWCHEKCHKPQNAPRRMAMEGAVRKHGGQLVNIKKARMLGTWISRGRTAKPPFALVTDWREAQPCARELEMDANKVNVPKIMIIVCTSARQAKKAQAWANGEAFEEDKEEGSVEDAGDAGGSEGGCAADEGADEGDAPEETGPKEPAVKPPEGIPLHIVEWTKIPQELLGGVLTQTFAAGDAAMKINGAPLEEPPKKAVLKVGAVDKNGNNSPMPPAPTALPTTSLQVKTQFMSSQVNQQYVQSPEAQTVFSREVNQQFMQSPEAQMVFSHEVNQQFMQSPEPQTVFSREVNPQFMQSPEPQTVFSRQAMRPGPMHLSPPGLCGPMESFDKAMTSHPMILPPGLGGRNVLEKVALQASYDRMSNNSVFQDHSPGRASTTLEPDIGSCNFSVMTEDPPLMYYSF